MQILGRLLHACEGDCLGHGSANLVAWIDSQLEHLQVSRSTWTQRGPGHSALPTCVSLAWLLLCELGDVCWCWSKGLTGCMTRPLAPGWQYDDAGIHKAACFKRLAFV